MDLFDLKVVDWQYDRNITDDLVIEAFNKVLINRRLKKEEVNVNNYETFNETKLAIFELIESWYNNI